MNYYISDLHFGHQNIIRLCNRPFKNVDEMDEKIIQNWNNVVKPEDTVYILGDLCFRNSKDPYYYLSRLNGHKHLIVGNHDDHTISNKKAAALFDSISDLKTIQDGNDKIVLFHYPITEWNGFFRGALHFYGHIHNNTRNNTYKTISSIPNAYNVGVDILDFIPRTKEEVIKYNNIFNSKH